MNSEEARDLIRFTRGWLLVQDGTWCNHGPESFNPEYPEEAAGVAALRFRESHEDFDKGTYPFDSVVFDSFVDWQRRNDPPETQTLMRSIQRYFIKGMTTKERLALEYAIADWLRISP